MPVLDYFWYKPIFSRFLWLPEKKSLPQNKKFLSVVFVVCSASTGYIRLCIGFKYLIKIPFLSKIILKWLAFWSSRLFLFWLKKYYKNDHLCLVVHSFTKLSLNVCLINTHILMYRYAWCDRMLWNIPFDFIAFFGYFYT